jgi:SpoVK/Ycf46/Vps4 family AAA+-type ATPase
MSAALPDLDDDGWSNLLHRTTSSVAAPRLQQLAQQLRVAHTLDDLVLPPDRTEALRDVVRRVAHRRTVFEKWRFDEVSSRGRGLIVLFSGASGTGKTMGAEAIADALKMNVYRIDLAGVVSKYIGETEKNLRAIFEEADRADAVLFFDEADALFGRRSEVKDSHDRYANIEINYLLQRIELFEGIAILATNMRGHIDEAFLRRIHITVELPLPGIEERLRLWDRSFPEAAPVTPEVDWNFLAHRFELTGGAIRNVALGAAFLAADSQPGTIGMPEVVNALRAELVKAGRRVADSEFGLYAKHLRVAPPADRPMRRVHRGEARPA